MELNNELTAQDSLRVITETLNNNRRAILRKHDAVAAMLLKTEAQLLLFTFGGILLMATGAIVNRQYK